jgi:hypothetical protein
MSHDPNRGYDHRPVYVTVKDDSPTFAIVTLLLWIFVYPLGFLLNVIGLITGPRRGCFAAMLLVFIVLPVATFLILFAIGVPFVVRLFETMQSLPSQ